MEITRLGIKDPSAREELLLMRQAAPEYLRHIEPGLFSKVSLVGVDDHYLMKQQTEMIPKIESLMLDLEKKMKSPSRPREVWEQLASQAFQDKIKMPEADIMHKLLELAEPEARGCALGQEIDLI